MNPSEEIKARLNVEDVLGEYISLRPAGANFRALCPFHQEKTPSFMISPEKQIWHCFGCGKGGDIFSFVMEMEGLSFSEALRLLAPKAGVTLKQEDFKESSRRNRLLDLMEEAKKYYLSALTQKPEMIKYLKDRGLKEETIKFWEIGYAPESWEDIILHLKAKGYKEEEIFLAGLSLKKEGTARYHNRFRDRIMFPIKDVNGNTIAFTARLNPFKSDPLSEKTGKYINSPETDIYNKGKVLFGLDKSKQAIKANDWALVVEGQMDLIAVYQSGMKNVVASSGTALTAEQIKLLKRYTSNVNLAFDADQAGQIAADRGIMEALKGEMNIKVIIIPSGKDPAECLKNKPEEWLRAVKDSKPMMQYYFEKAFEGIDLTRADYKKKAAEKVLGMIARIENTIEAGHWLRQLAEKIEVEESVLREAVAKSRSKGQKEAPKAQERANLAPLSREEKLSALFVALVLKYQELGLYGFNNLKPEELEGLQNRLFYNHLIIYYNTNKSLDYEGLKEYFRTNESSFLPLLDTLLLLADKELESETPLEEGKKEMIKIILELKRAKLKEEMKRLEKAMAQAEKDGQEDKMEALMEEFKSLSDKLKDYH